MTKLLYIEASPRKERSQSSAVARAFLERYAETHPDDEIDVLDLWAEDIPDMDGVFLDAKYAVLKGEAHSADQQAAWDEVARIAERFRSADKILFSLPMWNFTIPYPLKHYIDIITQPGLTFTYSDEAGYAGLAGGPAAVVYASGGAYHEGSGAEAMDFQKPYLKSWLGFVGISDVQDIHVAPTMEDPRAVEAAKQAALEQARAIAAEF